MGSGASRSQTHTIEGRPVTVSFLSTYKISDTFTFSQPHFLYADNATIFENLPVPKPPNSSKRQICEDLDYTFLDNRAEEAPSELLLKPYGELIDYLLEGLTTDIEKVRVLYRWITAQPLDILLVSADQPKTYLPMYHIWRIKNKEGNYAQWFAILCRHSNLPCVIVNGRLKGSTYKVGEQVLEDKHYGEWNAVLIDDCWRFIDAYWGACAAVEQKSANEANTSESANISIDPLKKTQPSDAKQSTGESGYVVEESKEKNRKNVSFKNEEGTIITDGDSDVAKIRRKDTLANLGLTLTYSCDENYFLPDPQQLIYSHIPEEASWQLLKNPWSLKKFETRANVKDRFFTFGMWLDSHKECCIRSESGDLDITLGVPPEEAAYYKFQYVLLKLDSMNRKAPKYNRYVFMHRPIDKSLCLRIRAPGSGAYQLELVGRDVRNDKQLAYNYDWVVIYKLLFDRPSAKTIPFPPHPDCGWGPASHTTSIGLSPLSHKTGEAKATSDGDVQISFNMDEPAKIDKYKIYGALMDCKGNDLPRRLVYRLEGSKLFINSKIPRKGEYSLYLYAENEDGVRGNWCNYFIISDQNKTADCYPKEISKRVGWRSACERINFKPISHPTAFIVAETNELEMTFEGSLENQVYHCLVANEKIDSTKYVNVAKDGRKLTYRLQFPHPDIYGFKLGIKSTEKENAIDPLFDYVITCLVGAQIRKQVTPPPEVVTETEEDRLRREIGIASDANDEEALIKISEVLKKKTEDWATLLLTIVLRKIDVIQTSNRLHDAMVIRHVERVKDELKRISENNYHEYMEEEIVQAKDFLKRYEHIISLLHKVLDLDQHAVSELRTYSHPPDSVHKVMMATLLLIGYYEDETKKWQKIQHLLGKTGGESVKRKIQAFNINTLQLDVAVGAKKLLGDMSVEEIRITSAGAAAFFIWTMGVIKEVETRHKEEMEQILPRTRRKKEKKILKREETTVDRARNLYGQ